ncbi:MAG TPA: acyl-CoA dehydrogenase, partial [Candidatus Berkiella sp.]|nr:acyl-CoA dehydrogenase [Candidatus Berkiella sp.]
PTPKLSEEEEAFLNGPAKQLCEMANDWEITHTLNDLPEQIWQFLIDNGFFALVIPKKYGGKGFSEFAHSEILTMLAGRSLTLASTVAVPNSLGPAELLLRYGTQAQADYYLPRLASGQEIPCFALTAPEAGSDAGAIPDTGIICKGQFEGKEIIGIKLNWNKRYITLAPIATLLGLAFKLYDPDELLGHKKELGITCALIPTNTKGVTTGRRHLPSNIPFQNGPTQGKNVFIPLDWIIGGPNMAGQGWRMLVECLSTGRAISLPSSSSGGARGAVLTCSAYSRIRRQFHTSISNFEGIQEVLARIGGFTYLSEAVRHLTVAMVDAGEKPSVPGAISKYHVTELGRKIANDAMDLHGGKGIMMGPNNYLCRSYQGVPIGITVEGANILTRNMIIFGQGAIRCHPYVLKEMHAIQHHNVQEFEHYMGQHISFTLSNVAHALFHGLTFSHFANSPTANGMKRYYQQLGRASSAFALVADSAMALLGGKLKFKESISSRLGDLLSMMYLISAVLKRYQDQGSQTADLPLVRWSLDYCLAQYWQAMNELLRNFPNRGVAFGLRVLVMPFGVPCHYPKDKLNREITELLTTQSDTRARLLEGVFISNNPQDPIRVLSSAFEAIIANTTLIKQVFDASKNH